LSLLVTVPFIGLRNLTNEAGSVFLVIKIVYYLAMVFLTPLIYSIYAAAYNSLAYQEESFVPTIKTASLPLKSRTSN
jgi:hypothetical protein